MNEYKITGTQTGVCSLKCPICNCHANIWVQLPSVTLLRCVKCTHCFTDTSSITQEESYGSDYYQNTHRNWFENPNYPLFAVLKSELTRHHATSILDIGCGNGAFLKYLNQTPEDLELHGIDLSTAAKPISGIILQQGNVLHYDFQKKFDAIITLAVIEHLSDISSFVKRIHELLNKNGIACIMTLNENGILYRLANLLRKLGFPSVFVRLYDPHHLNHFSKESLERLLTKDNLFKVNKVINHNTVLKAIDVPPTTHLFIKWVMKLGVAAVFFLGKITKKTYLQTIIISKIE